MLAWLRKVSASPEDPKKHYFHAGGGDLSSSREKKDVGW